MASMCFEMVRVWKDWVDSQLGSNMSFFRREKGKQRPGQGSRFSPFLRNPQVLPRQMFKQYPHNRLPYLGTPCASSERLCRACPLSRELQHPPPPWEGSSLTGSTPLPQPWFLCLPLGCRCLFSSVSLARACFHQSHWLFWEKLAFLIVLFHNISWVQSLHHCRNGSHQALPALLRLTTWCWGIGSFRRWERELWSLCRRENSFYPVIRLQWGFQSIQLLTQYCCVLLATRIRVKKYLSDCCKVVEKLAARGGGGIRGRNREVSPHWEGWAGEQGREGGREEPVP